MKRLGIIVVLLLAVACGSSSAPVMTQPTANIAGTYPTSVVTNAGIATFTNCTGDIVIAEGLAIVVDASCVTQDPLIVTQNGNSWQAGNQFVICFDYTYVVTASGTINVDRIDGIITVDYNFGVTETQTITNGVVGTGGTIVLRIPRLTVSGGLSGSCSIVPPLEVVHSQNRSSKSDGVGILGNLK